MYISPVSPDNMEATAAIMKDTMTPGPAISLATSPETTYIPVPTQLPTPSDTRSTVDKTRASLVPCELVPVMAESNMDSTGLVLRTRDAKVFHAAPHCTLRGSSFPARPLIVRGKGQGSESRGKSFHKEEWDSFTVVWWKQQCAALWTISWSFSERWKFQKKIWRRLGAVASAFLNSLVVVQRNSFSTWWESKLSEKQRGPDLFLRHFTAHCLPLFFWHNAYFSSTHAKTQVPIGGDSLHSRPQLKRTWMRKRLIRSPLPLALLL